MAKRIYYESLKYQYSMEDVYSLASELGDDLARYLGEDVFILLLDSKVLRKIYVNTSNSSWQIFPAALAFEAFLEKIVKNKKLRFHKKDKIGEIFGEKSHNVKTKIKNKKLIAKVKATWDFCRNDMLHYNKKLEIDSIYVHKKVNEIIETIKLLYEDFYGESVANKEINMGVDKYSSYKSKKYKFKSYLKRLINKI